MKRSNQRLVLVAVVSTLLVVALTWPGGITLRAEPPASNFTGGPVTLMGIDTEEIGHPAPADYTLLINTMLSKASNSGSGVLVIGAGKASCTDTFFGGTDSVKTFWETVDTNITSQVFMYLNGSAISEINLTYLSSFKMVIVASSDTEIGGGCGLTNAENEALATKKELVKAFVNDGGALLGFTGAGLTKPYGYIVGLGDFVFHAGAGTGAGFNDITPTTEGAALGITDAAFDKCCWHDTFASFPSFLKALATATGTSAGTRAGEAAAVGGTQVVIELCNADGSPNGVNEDGDATFDEGCYRERQLFFTPTSTNQTATFTDLGDVQDHSFGLRYMFGVKRNFSATIRSTIEDPADVTFSGEFDATTTCSFNKLDGTQPPDSEEPCVRYQIIGGVADEDYVAGDRAVQFRIAFFQPAAQKDGTDPVMGYSADGATFDKSILDHAIFPPGEDPEGIGYVDEYGSYVIMGVKTQPLVPPAVDACHADGTPNGIDEDGDGVFDDGCAVERSANMSPDDPSETYEFNDLGNTKPNSIGINHISGVTNAFNLKVVATIVNPDDLSFVAPGYPGPGRTVCAANSIFNATPTTPLSDLPCVQYELFGPDGTPYVIGNPNDPDDGVELTITYFAPRSQSATQVAGMGYSDTCNNVYNRNILARFRVFSGDDADPEGIGYVDEYGSCVVMTATEPPPPVLNLPDLDPVMATSAAGAPVTFSATATGVIDGVLSTIPATCDATSGATFPIGRTTVNCTGGTTFPSLSDSFDIDVVYGICVLYDTVKPKKAGSTIPIKLNLCDASGNNLSSPNIVVHAVSLTPEGGAPAGDPEDPGNSQPDDNFRFTSPSYHFNFKTTGLASGTWTLNFTVGGDPTVYSTPFSIK